MEALGCSQRYQPRSTALAPSQYPTPTPPHPPTTTFCHTNPTEPNETRRTSQAIQPTAHSTQGKDVIDLGISGEEHPPKVTVGESLNVKHVSAGRAVDAGNMLQ